MRIVHIAPDSAFVTFLADVFEEVEPDSNEFLILAPGSAADLRHSLPGRVTTFDPHIRSARQISAAAWGADLLVAHGMSAHAAVAFRRSKSRTIRLWSGWGADYYGSALTDHGWELLDARTRRWALEQPSVRLRLRTRAVQAMIRRNIKLAAGVTDLFSAPVPSDEEIFRRRFPSFKGDYAQLNYCSVQSSFAAQDATGGRDILVGNSASVENNHLDAFELLVRHDLSGRRVIVPLTYGTASYRNMVIREGENLLGPAFHPLVDQLPLSDYVRVLAECSVVIMNHKRQQGVGNIGAALHAGSHLYLNPSNPTLNFLRRIGAEVHNIEELLTDSLPAEQVPPSTRRDTRAALEGFWGHSQVVENVRRLTTGIH